MMMMNDDERYQKRNWNRMVSYRNRVGEKQRDIQRRDVVENVGNPPLSRISNYPDTNPVS